MTDEELIEELSFPVYRRVATWIFVPAKSASSVEMVAIDPLDLQEAQDRDAGDLTSIKCSRTIPGRADPRERLTKAD